MESLTIHSFDVDLWGRYGQKFDQTKLVDLLELSLKNTNNYVEAIQSFIELPEIKSYLEQYIIPIHADFPGQLFIRRAIKIFTVFYEDIPQQKVSSKIQGHAYHEECFRVLEETQIESDINEEMDEDSCELEETDSYKSKVETDSELQKRILGNV
ncbi:hypothetical protein C1646_818028 [Rhizophagus diaphanus]|nr:hypothetical protein C1646_818028 [Rhizophagus diaphanus] [Rhizophagus sp. MUCL 43196]